MEGSDRDQFEILHWKKLELINDSHEKTQSKVRLRDCILRLDIPENKAVLPPTRHEFPFFFNSFINSYRPAVNGVITQLATEARGRSHGGLCGRTMWHCGGRGEAVFLAEYLFPSTTIPLFHIHPSTINSLTYLSVAIDVTILSIYSDPKKTHASLGRMF